MVIFVIDLFTKLSSIVILTMLLAAVKMNIHKISAPCSMTGKARKTLLSPAEFFIDRLSYNNFLYHLSQLFSGSKCPHRHAFVILHRCVSADRSLACASVHHGHELRFSIS
jgi:hypothetical protein